MHEDDISVPDDLSCFLLYHLIRIENPSVVVLIHGLTEDFFCLQKGGERRRGVGREEVRGGEGWGREVEGKGRGLAEVQSNWQ